LRTHLKIRIQEAQANATQQVEAIALAVSAMFSKGEGGGSSAKPQSAEELQSGLSQLMNMMG
jgi:hypothetical protein